MKYILGTKKSYFGSIAFIVCVILVGGCFFSNNSDKSKSEKKEITNTQTVNNENSAPYPTSETIFGAPVNNFIQRYGKLNPALTSKELHIYTFKKNNFKIDGNGGNPEIVQSMHIDLRKRSTDQKVINPEQSSVKSKDEVNAVIQKFLPPDAILIKERDFQDTTYKPPLAHYKTFRLYESKWLGERITSPIYSIQEIDILPKGQFTVILDQTDTGYLGIVFDIASQPWEEIDEGYYSKNGWVEVK